MLVIGLTGGISSGKTTVANLFATKGITIIDTDIISRQVTEPGKTGLNEIVNKFGADIILPNNTLDRGKLRSIVFADQAKRLWLEQLLHPLIRTEMYEQIQSATSPYCIAVIPLLFETKPYSLINRILVVDATEEQQLKRATARDNISLEQINSILKTQVSRAKRLSAADDVIFNSGNLEELYSQVDKLHEFYLSLSQ